VSARTNVPVDKPGSVLDVTVLASKGGTSKSVKKELRIAAGSASASCTLPP
jgi:hypothetical protein